MLLNVTRQIDYLRQNYLLTARDAATLGDTLAELHQRLRRLLTDDARLEVRYNDFFNSVNCIQQRGGLVRTFVTEHEFGFQEIKDADLSRAFGRQIERLHRYAPRLRPGRVEEFIGSYPIRVGKSFSTLSDRGSL